MPWQLVLSDFSYLHYSRVLRSCNQPETAFSVRFGCGAGAESFSATDAAAGSGFFVCIINKNRKILPFLYYILTAQLIYCKLNSGNLIIMGLMM